MFKWVGQGWNEFSLVLIGHSWSLSTNGWLLGNSPLWAIKALSQSDTMMCYSIHVPYWGQWAEAHYKMCSDKQGDTRLHQDRLMIRDVYRYDLFFSLICIPKCCGFYKMRKRGGENNSIRYNLLFWNTFFENKSSDYLPWLTWLSIRRYKVLLYRQGKCHDFYPSTKTQKQLLLLPSPSYLFL